MLGPQLQLRSLATFVVTLVLAWVLTPWLGMESFLYVPLFVFFVSTGLVAVWTIDEWLRELLTERRNEVTVAEKGGEL